MLDWGEAVGAPVEAACVGIMLFLIPGTMTVAVLLSVAVAIIAPMVGPAKVPVLPAIVAEAESLGGLTVATVAVAATALWRPVVESGTAAMPVVVAGCSVVGTEWSVGAAVAAVPEAGGEMASFCFVGVGGCVDSLFSPSPLLGCGAVLEAAVGLWSVATVVLPADPLSSVDVVVNADKAFLDTEEVVRLTSCDQTLSRTPKDKIK